MSRFVRRLRRALGPKRCPECGDPLYQSDNPHGPREFCNRCSPGKPMPPDMLAQHRKVPA